MAPLQYLSFKKVLLSYIALFLFTSLLVSTCSQSQTPRNDFARPRRMLLEIEEEEDQPIIKKRSFIVSTKNQTKLIKPTSTSSKGQTKLIKTANTSSKNKTKLSKTTTGSAKYGTKLIKLTSDSTKNKTKLAKPTKDSTTETITTKIQVKKSSNSTKPSSNLLKKSSDLTKSSSPKNKTSKPGPIKQSQIELKPKNPEKDESTEKKAKPTKPQKPTQPAWIKPDEEDDLIAEFRDLPSKFHETLLPDLERISTTSKVYLTKYNKQITKGFKPIVGTKYAPTVASIVSFTFILIPLLLVSLIFNRIKAYFSLQKIIIFIQVYLCIYFAILCLSSLVTGLEPLRFFYATSRSTYICMQVLQTLAYVLYLLLLLMYLILVFSTEAGLGSKMLGLGQTLVGFAVGLHYYMTVFHRAVLHEPPKTSWRIHGIYATCFLVICLLARADRRKKAYLEEGGEEGKKS
ncbi:hypothetical protein NMG60_11007323 [Bertholletia excelsa]